MRANVLVYSTDTTWAMVEDVPSGEQRIEAFLDLSSHSDIEAERLATAELARIRDGQTQITVGIDPTGDGDVPFDDWGIGDLADVDAAERRCLGLTFARDPDRNGRIVYVPQFGDIIDTAEVRQAKIHRRMNPGTLGGVSRTAGRSQLSLPLPEDSTVRKRIVVLSQAEYDALDPGPLDGVMYAITS